MRPRCTRGRARNNLECCDSVVESGYSDTVLSLPRSGTARGGVGADASRPQASPPAASRPGSAWRADRREDLVAAAPGWLLARVIVLGTLIGARALTDRLEAVPEPIRRHVAQGLLGWDAERYLQIAASGYTALPATELRFFPLLPALVRWLDPVLPGGPGAALLAISNLAALAFAVVLHRLALRETGDVTLARRAAWFASIFPTGFVFAWGYTESLWCALSAGALLAARRNRWWAAAGLAAAAALLRPVGVLLALPLVIEAFRCMQGRRQAPALLAPLAPVAAAGAYLGWVGRSFGDPLLPFTIQQTASFRGETVDPLRALWRPTAALLTGEVTIDSLRAVWFVGLAALVVVVARRWAASYAVFAVSMLVVALSTTRLGSFERYTFTAFPILLALATVSARPALERVLLAAGGALLGVYGLLALLGAYVP